jgi:UV excision repair protein RAD23
VNCEPTDSIATLKEKISLAQSEYPAQRQKLIFSGKVLVDESIISDSGVTEADFLVIMVTKEKPAPRVQPSSSAVAAPPPVVELPPPAQLAPSAQLAPPAVQNPVPDLSPEIRQIVDMGFPETEARAAFLAANGNAALALDYLMGGMPIPAPIPWQQPQATSELDQLRHHPQINHLRSLLQQNPGALGDVLGAIGKSMIIVTNDHSC